jgi:hypothetical protein
VLLVANAERFKPAAGRCVCGGVESAAHGYGDVIEMPNSNRRSQVIAVPSWGRAAVFPVMMESFLRSRTESGNPSNVDYYEEDVNVYIVDLLCVLLDPVYYLQMQKYVGRTDSDVFDKVRDSTDVRLRYWVYKANADNLLLSLGVFGSRDGGGRVVVGRGGGASRGDSGRAKLYYEFARSYGEQLFGRPKGVADVLDKLSRGFDKYVDILDHMRVEYLNIIETISEGEMFHLQRDIDRVREEEFLKKKYDELLDCYLEWKRTGDRRLLAELKTLSQELRGLDPTFKFDVPEPCLR